MFDQILGLPAHALIIHFAVVLTPLLVAVAAAYAVMPRWRTFTAWAVVLLSLAAPASVYAAKESGESLKAARFATAEGVLGTRIATHEGFATPLLFSVLGLAAAALVLVFATSPVRAAVGRDRFGKPTTMALSALTLALAAVSGYYVFQAGDSGARAVWGM
jgi:glucan phosphoethanolaminetransferase (alkaline phosphatase superfamily)